MPCDTPTPCPTCNPDYTEIGCPDYPWTSCIIYNGDDIPCLDISKTENLNEIINHLKDVVCSLTPTGYASFDFSCFTSQNITTEKEFVEFISTLLCSILGTQTPTTVTSLSSLYTLIQTLTTDLNLVKNQNLISCFQNISGLSSPQNITQVLTAVQSIICDHETRITNLESGSVNTNITVVNTNHDVTLLASGTNNHTLSADVKIDPDSSNSITTSSAGLLSVSPDIAVVDTQSINFSASGTKNHTITADVKISATVNNAASILADGIYVNPASITETPFVSNDSTSINFSQSGVNGHTITADVILNPSISNLIQSTGSGLLVNASSVQDPISPIDTETINLTVTGTSNHILRADVVVSPTVNNVIQTLSDGLYVNGAAFASDGWLLTGNVIGDTDYIGTNNDKALNFKVNSIKAGKVNSNGQTLFGFQSGFSNTATLATAYGYLSLNSNTTGSENVAVGNRALFTNTTGIDSVAVGSNALGLANGDKNAAFGHRSLNTATSGTLNTAIGGQAGTDLISGSYNTFLGALTSTSLDSVDKSVAIGYNASVSASNTMALGGTGVDAISVVIGGTTAQTTAVVDINSTTQGFLPPRMTTAQRTAIASPAEGLVVYDLTLHKHYGYDGTIWNAFY